MATNITLEVNGNRAEIELDDPDMPLLYALRDNLALRGPRFGCGLGQCGACTVIIDGEAVRSCITRTSAVEGKSITTLEGLGSSANPHPVQAAFIETGAAQCGYCTNGMIMETKVFLERNPKPSETEVKEALARNLCRCGTHVRIVQAVMLAAESMGRA